MIVVSNTSPICYLVLIDRADLLPQLFGQVIVPPAVFQELTAAGAPERLQKMIQSLPDWLAVSPLAQLPGDDLLDLDPGEREAIVLATEIGAELVLLDDQAAREAAARGGLRITGVLGILLEASSRELVDLPDAIARLRRTNFRASPRLLRSVLRRCKRPARADVRP